MLSEITFWSENGALTGCLTCIRYRNRTQPRFDKKLPCEPPLGRGAEKEALPHRFKPLNSTPPEPLEKFFILFSLDKLIFLFGQKYPFLKTNGRN